MRKKRSDKAAKTSAERSREFRARQALIKQQIKQQQEPDAILEIAPEDIRRTRERRAKCAERTRRWRERKKNSSESKNQAISGAQTRECQKKIKFPMCDDIKIEEHDILTDPKIGALFPDITKLKNEISDLTDGTKGETSVFQTVSFKKEPLDIPVSEIHEEHIENSTLSDIKSIHTRIKQRNEPMTVIHDDIKMEFDDEDKYRNPMQHVSISVNNRIFDPSGMPVLTINPGLKDKPDPECSGTTVDIHKRSMCDNIEIEEHDILTDPKIAVILPDITKIKNEIPDLTDGIEDETTVLPIVSFKKEPDETTIFQTVSFKKEPLDVPVDEVHEEHEGTSTLSDIKSIHTHIGQRNDTMTVIHDDIKIEFDDEDRYRNPMQHVSISVNNRILDPSGMPVLTINPGINDEPDQECSEISADIHKSTASNYTVDQPDEPMDVTDLPPSRSDVLLEAQDASTFKKLSVVPPTITARKTKAEKQREYRQRIAASRTSAQVIAARKLDAERQRKFKLRKAAYLAHASGSLELTTSPSEIRSIDVQSDIRKLLKHQSAEPTQITAQPGSSEQSKLQQAQSNWNSKWTSSIMRFKLTFLDNDFGYACSVCDRLWFKNDLKPITPAQLEVISEWFVKENRPVCKEEYKTVCSTCKRTLNKKSMPPLAKVNGFSYPEQPPNLPPLDSISERLISPRLPFMQVRRLRHDICHGIIGQVINVPVDVQDLAGCLPRQLNEDDVININTERNLIHESVYISGYMSESVISAWLTVLQKSPLYSLYEIDVDLSRLRPTVLDDIQDDPSNRIENISVETPESEILASRQHTMMWSEEDCLNIAPGLQATPPSNIYDRHAEELSFPSVYFGVPRQINKGVPVTPYMIAKSEIRRRDRRGATPQKILYVAMKLLRLRMADVLHSTFRNVSLTEGVTRRMLDDPEFLKEYVKQNLAFMKTVPNSIQYWASRKRDLYAMIRQLGKPTVFLTIGANETRWTKLLTILLRLSKKYQGKTVKDLNFSDRCTLVSDDPVTCCIYFYRLVGSFIKILKSKQTYNPFGKYIVKDYFLRVDFQQGSPQAHILLWLNDDPRETVSENMPKTIDLMEQLSSVSRSDVPNDSVYANQIHKHTFTCTKEETCRFGIPYWPMITTRVLIPIAQSEGFRQTLQQKAKELQTFLGERRYANMDGFLSGNGLTYDSYLDIVRSTLRKPTLLFKRNFDELETNTFNPYLAGEVDSNIHIQYILDEYSCAEYIAEYITNSARGMSNLRLELTKMMQEHPNQDYTGRLKALSSKLLNSVEISAPEAAWYLLRQPMSETSRPVVYIPTVWPSERQCCRKRRLQASRESIADADVWTKNIVQRYEERPASLEHVYLAEFASWYANANDFVDEEDDVHMDDEDSEASPRNSSKAPKQYRRRPLGRIIRYRRYGIDETIDYKRELVLLYVPFRNEISEIIDQNKFLQLFEDNKGAIMERRSLFETNLNFETVMKEAILQDKSNSQEESRAEFVQRLLDGGEDVEDQTVPRQGSKIVKASIPGRFRLRRLLQLR